MFNCESRIHVQEPRLTVKQCAHYLFTFIAFDARRTQPIILGFLWYTVGIPVVYSWDSCSIRLGFLWYSRMTFCTCGTHFRRTSAFSAPSWIIYLVLSTSHSDAKMTVCVASGTLGKLFQTDCVLSGKVNHFTPIFPLEFHVYLAFRERAVS